MAKTKNPKQKPAKATKQQAYRDETLADLDEIARLWPRLDDALEVDTAGPSAASGNRRATPEPTSAAAVNLDVVHAQAEVQTDLDKITSQAVALLNLGAIHRSTAAILANLPTWYQTLAGMQHGRPLARQIEHDAARWRRVIRSALLLRTREQPTGSLCPFHRDEPAELIREADEADLTKTGIEWRRADSVRCPHCKNRWAGDRLFMLRRMIREADEHEPAAIPTPIVSLVRRVQKRRRAVIDVDGRTFPRSLTGLHSKLHALGRQPTDDLNFDCPVIVAGTFVMRIAHRYGLDGEAAEAWFRLTNEVIR